MAFVRDTRGFGDDVLGVMRTSSEGGAGERCVGGEYVDQLCVSAKQNASAIIFISQSPTLLCSMRASVSASRCNTPKPKSAIYSSSMWLEIVC